MCCFSGPVDRVAGTRIFARFVGPATQLLVYQMKVAARSDVAMVLPIPVAPGAGADAVRFVSLEPYPKFFDDLDRAFPKPVLRGFGLASGAIPQPASLRVHEVGAFVASFVPTRADFARVDPRFRLPDAAFDAIREYASYGFAVFQLRELGTSLREVHPMAFEFPTARPAELFFPTLHVHDGRAHDKAPFDHVLYAQGASLGGAIDSDGPLGRHVDASRVPGILDPDAPGISWTIQGNSWNVDHWMPRT